MNKFIEKIQKISKENGKTAIFVDMDGTITVYNVYPEHDVAKKMEEEYEQAEPASYVIELLEKIEKMQNIDIYILTLSKSKKITEQKKKWLKIRFYLQQQ